MMEVDVEELLLRAQALTRKSWFWKVLLYLPLVMLVAYVLYKFDQDSRELARLHTELEILKIRKQNAETDAKAASAQEKKAMLELEAKMLSAEVEKREASLREEQKRHEERSKRIESISSWTELDAEWERRSGGPSASVDKPSQPSTVDPWPDSSTPTGKPN